MKLIKYYIIIVEKIGYIIGRMSMYTIFLMIGILLYSSISKAFFMPSMWTLEIAQFLMVSYFLLGGAYSLQMGSHVRMDLFYGNWSDKKKHLIDALTMLFLIIYLFIVLYGSISSFLYALEYSERSYSSWRPYMWPIKAIITLGITLMLLQAIAEFLKDILAIIGRPFI